MPILIGGSTQPLRVPGDIEGLPSLDAKRKDVLPEGYRGFLPEEERPNIKMLNEENFPGFRGLTGQHLGKPLDNVKGPDGGSVLSTAATNQLHSSTVVEVDGHKVTLPMGTSIKTGQRAYSEWEGRASQKAMIAHTPSDGTIYGSPIEVTLADGGIKQLGAGARVKGNVAFEPGSHEGLLLYTSKSSLESLPIKTQQTMSSVSVAPAAKKKGLWGRMGSKIKGLFKPPASSFSKEGTGLDIPKIPGVGELPNSVSNKVTEITTKSSRAPSAILKEAKKP